MKADDIQLLQDARFDAELINVLISLDYQVDSYSPVTEVIEVSTPPDAYPGTPSHGFSIHRSQAPHSIVMSIFEAGVLAHQKQTRDAFQGLLTAAGMQLR
jgi:hypothetical protein